MTYRENFDLQARYDLICRASQSSLEQQHDRLELGKHLKQLQEMILTDLPALARSGSPDNFADILRSLDLELDQFSEFCEFSDLAQKVVVGFGGAFSAGKSTLINTILGKKRLVVEVDPTTSLPTYLLHGQEDRITALNLFRRRVELSQDEFSSLTHDEQKTYGSQVAGLLRSAFIHDPDFAWRNLALLDTPGYSKPDSEEHSARTDEKVAHAQLNSAHFIVWVISAAQGTISEEDLKFLSSLNSDIPKLIVVSHADAKTPDDIKSIVELIRNTLAERAINVLDVIPTSRKKRDYPIAPIVTWFEKWNSAPRGLSFAQNFKRQFTIYARFIESEQRQAHLRLNRLNRILTLADMPEIQRDAEELQLSAQAELKKWDEVTKSLLILQNDFFTELKKIGEQVGIPMPEPSELELLDIRGVDLLGMLRELRKADGKAETDYSHLWRALTTVETPTNINRLLRRTANTSALRTLLA